MPAEVRILLILISWVLAFLLNGNRQTNGAWRGGGIPSGLKKEEDVWGFRWLLCDELRLDVERVSPSAVNRIRVDTPEAIWSKKVIQLVDLAAAPIHVVKVHFGYDHVDVAQELGRALEGQQFGPLNVNQQRVEPLWHQVPLFEQVVQSHPRDRDDMVLLDDARVVIEHPGRLQNRVALVIVRDMELDGAALVKNGPVDECNVGKVFIVLLKPRKDVRVGLNQQGMPKAQRLVEFALALAVVGADLNHAANVNVKIGRHLERIHVKLGAGFAPGDHGEHALVNGDDLDDFVVPFRIPERVALEYARLAALISDFENRVTRAGQILVDGLNGPKIECIQWELEEIDP